MWTTASFRWKHKWLIASVVLCQVSTSLATSIPDSAVLQQHPLQPDNLYQDTDSPTNADEQGQLLYRVAMRQLETIQSTTRSHTPTAYDTAETSLWDTIHSSLASITHFIWPDDHHDTPTTPSQNQERLEAATRMLETAATNYNNLDSLMVLADMNFYARYTHPRNYTKAFGYYKDLAATGNATAQQMVGFMYATGIGGAVPRDQAQALLYHTFAAHGGDTLAEMTLGYRYLLGIGTDQKCEDAVYYYQKVAEKAINYYLSGPIGGHATPLSKVRLSDEVGGVYGYGASVMTDRRHRNNGGGSDRSVSIEEVLQYWRYLAQTRSDFEAQLMLGQVYYQGTRSISRNFEEAFYFFRQVTDKLPSGKVPQALVNSKRGKAIGQAAGYLGRMFMRGEGVDIDDELALQWFHVGAEFNDSMSQNGLGIMYLEGIVVAQDRDKAIEYFKRAANQENPEAQVNLAMEYVKQESTLPIAVRLFTLAADAKHLLAYWYLAQLNHAGIGVKPSCQVAVSFYKSIAERSDWLHPTVEDAYTAYQHGDVESALLHYTLAAERGYEIAQSNVAYLLDTDTHLLKLSDPPKRDPAAEESALIYWSRSANQNNVDSRVKMGDYYFRGIGTPVDYEKAAACYRIAAEIELSPLAMWTMGWMYENGVGVAKDFHLAKRAYDNALTINPDAYLPVKLSLAKLYLRYYWSWMTGADIGQGISPPAQQDDSNSNGQSALWGQGDQGGEDHHTATPAQEAQRRKEIEAYEHDRAHWEISTDEELRRKFSKHMKRLEREEGDDLADLTSGSGLDRDYYGREGEYDDEDDDEYSEEDELVESLMILALCVLVGWLVYMRQFRFNRQGGNNNNHNNDNDNHNGLQQRDGGLPGNHPQP